MGWTGHYFPVLKYHYLFRNRGTTNLRAAVGSFWPAAVGELALELGLLKSVAKVRPISIADYPAPTSRAALKLKAQQWHAVLKDVLHAIPTIP